MEVHATMTQSNEPQVGAEANRQEVERIPDEETQSGLTPSGSKGQHAAGDPAIKLEEARREVSSKIEQVRTRIRRDMAHKKGKIEEDIAAHEAESDYMLGVDEEGDIDTFRLTVIDQQSKYDAYANSHGPASTRPVGE
jgi:hypothetical protein